jgi:hypothetical protein
MTIDISEQVLARFRYRQLPEPTTVALSIKRQMISWLEENVGEYYGEVEQTGSRAYTGNGWEWGTRQETVYTHPSGRGVQTTWFVKIDDEAAATMFRLKFL